MGSILDRLEGNKEGFFTQSMRSALRDPKKLSRELREAEKLGRPTDSGRQRPGVDPRAVLPGLRPPPPRTPPSQASQSPELQVYLSTRGGGERGSAPSSGVSSEAWREGRGRGAKVLGEGEGSSILP